jgi:hypothetical protein
MTEPLDLDALEQEIRSTFLLHEHQPNRYRYYFDDRHDGEGGYGYRDDLLAQDALALIAELRAAQEQITGDALIKNELTHDLARAEARAATYLRLDAETRTTLARLRETDAELERYKTTLRTEQAEHRSDIARAMAAERQRDDAYEDSRMTQDRLQRSTEANARLKRIEAGARAALEQPTYGRLVAVLRAALKSAE